MKNIIFVTNRLGGKGWGGAHRVTTILANYFARKEYNVTMIVWEKSDIEYPINEKINIINLGFEKLNEKDRIKALSLYATKIGKSK